MRAELALYLLAALLLLAGFGLPVAEIPPFELGPRVPGTLRVVTWNVGQAGGDWGRSLDDDHVEHVARTLVELEPDLVFLQEVRFGPQTAALASALGAGWELETAKSGRGRRVVALSRLPNLRRIEPSGSLPPGALIVRFEHGDGRVVAALGIHADVASAAERNAEIGAALEALLIVPEVGGYLLLGDLNIDLDLDKRRDLFTDDAYRDVETYNFVADRLLDAARGAGSTAEPDRRLDYVFVDPTAFEVLSAGPVHGRRLGDMDHHPVAADLIYRR